MLKFLSICIHSWFTEVITHQVEFSIIDSRKIIYYDLKVNLLNLIYQFYLDLLRDETNTTIVKYKKKYQIRTKLMLYWTHHYLSTCFF